MDINKLCLKCITETLSNGKCTSCGTMAGHIQEPAFALPLNTILHGRYLIGAVLGHGGFGISYIAYDLKSNQRVAIKEYMPDGLSTRIPGTTEMTVHTNREDYQYGLEKFLEEARIIYKYNENPNIISVSALFEENRTAYYVMEYLDGCDLKKYIASRGGSLGWNEVFNLLLPVFEALEIIHRQSIIHRDISPDNIYVCKNGRVKLLDFGAARVALKGRSQSLSIILKRGFAPEEQYRSHGKQGPFTDIYALAGTMYLCLTGTVPPEATQRMYQDELIPPSGLCPGLPQHVNKAIVKALSVKAENRYQSIGEFKAALKGEAPVQRAATAPENEPLISNAAVPSKGGANPWKRLAAFILDGLLISAVFYGVLFQLLQLNTLEDLYLSIYIISTVYGACFEASRLKATLGKKLMGLQVTDAYGSSISFGKALLRNGIKYSGSVSGIFISIWVGAVASLVNGGLCFMNNRRQTGHDLILKTLVTLVQPNASVGVNQKINASFEPEGRQSEPPPRGGTALGIEGLSGYYQNVFFPLSDKKIVLGRNPEYCNIVFPNGLPGISRIHCEVSIENGAVRLKDLGSSQGTFVEGGKRIEAQKEVMLFPGQFFTIGENNTFRVNAS